MANPNLEQTLIELYTKNRDVLGSYQWEMEETRWNELVVTILISLGIDPSVARRAIDVLIDLQIASCSALATADADRRKLASDVLGQLGVEKEQSVRAVERLSKIAAMTQARWGGHIQRFLRERGREVVDSLVVFLEQEGLEKPASQRAATLWLQNVANLPILMPGDFHVQRFCQAHDVSEEELLDLADRLGLNIAVLDDLLAVDLEKREVA